LAWRAILNKSCGDAKHTERALRGDVELFTGWCRQQGHQALPASPETVAAFVPARSARAEAGIYRYGP
jgi:hypothetical protein